MPKLTVKQEAFCLHYAKTGNATESYLVAGYKATTNNVARTESSKLLAKPNIKARLQEIAEEIHASEIADITEIQKTLTAILRNESKEQVVIVENVGDFTSKARAVEKDTSIKDRIKAGETLAKMQGAFDSKFQVELTVPVYGGEEEFEAEEEES